MKGNVFDIQRYSIHDGEGIRTVVFLKGCPLSCRWCSNPESQSAHPQIFYIRSRCIGCLSCVHACPDKEVEAAEPGIYAGSGSAPAAEDASAQPAPVAVHYDRCRGDLSWVHACPTGALRVKGEWMESDRVMEEIRKDRVFYDKSGGGVTLSGGEPLLQREFACEILRRCREEGIRTAVETTGAVSRETLERALQWTDLFLYDIKAMDPEVHRKWTGRDNRLILENLKALSRAGARIMVRTPFIPGVNDREEDILAILAYLKECGLTHYDILPFHQYGSGKYESIGETYALAGLQPPGQEQADEIRRLIVREGFSRQLPGAD